MSHGTYLLSTDASQEIPYYLSELVRTLFFSSNGNYLETLQENKVKKLLENLAEKAANKNQKAVLKLSFPFCTLLRIKLSKRNNLFLDNKLSNDLTFN